MLAISIRQPWAWMILHAGKDIENRTWSTKVRGRVLIHAAKSMTKGDFEDAAWFARERCGVSDDTMRGCNPESLLRGGVVGSVEIVDCVKSTDSPWFMGDYGFVLRNPEIIQFNPCLGKLNFFDIPM
jgi:ASCH domain